MEHSYWPIAQIGPIDFALRLKPKNPKNEAVVVVYHTHLPNSLGLGQEWSH